MKKIDRELFDAARRGNLDAAGDALDKGADVNARDNRGRTPLHETARYGGGVEMVKLLIVRGADIEAIDEYEETPLRCATWRGRMKIAAVLLEHGALASMYDDAAAFALMLPFFRGRAKHMRAIIDQKLSDAVRYGDLDAAQAALDEGADVDAKDKDGWPLLRVALLYGHPKLAALLEAHGGTK